MKIGLFFGSFNPIHIGHLIIANTMLEFTDLRKVWFVVSPQNPFKKADHLLHEQDRLDLVARAVADHYDLAACDIEFRLPRPSYTAHTLVHLQEKYPDREFALILGEDNLATFHRWKNYAHILEHYSLYVYPRPQARDTDLRHHEKVTWVEAPLLDISATFIRKCIRAGKSVRYLVPDEVEIRIRAKKYFV